MSVAIITGASSGIGRQFAKELKESLNITEFYFISRSTEKMERLRDELGVTARIISADLTKREGIEAVRAALLEDKPKISYLVNAAGFGKLGTFSEVSERDVNDMIDLNIKALVSITNMCIPYMEAGSRIIELGSASAFVPMPAFNVYASTKAFVRHYTTALNYELKEYGIRATCFCPIWVDTDFLDVATSEKGITVPKIIWPLLNVQRVVRGCVRAARRGKALYVTNVAAKAVHLLYKLLPSSLLSFVWNKTLKRNEE